MHLHALDTYRPGSSPLHRLDPRVKLVLVVLFILAASLVPDQGWPAFGVLELLLLLAILLSHVGFGLVQRRSALALPFMLAAVTVIFTTPAGSAPAAPVLVIPGLRWAVTAAGLLRFAAIAARSYLSIQAAVLLSSTTPFPDLLWGLQALRVPRVLVATTGFLYRYLFVLADEARRMLQAREVRSAAPEGRGGGSLWWRARVTGAMAGTLFIRAYERSERIYAAMLLRGYDGALRTLSPPALRPVDVAVGGLGVLLLAVLVTAARLVL